MKKTFSVIIATCNREKFLREAIDSVLQQTFDNYEIVLVDDGSGGEIREKITARYGNRLLVVDSNKAGSERAYQRGASVATGQYLAFLDDDDLYLAWTLDTYAKIIRDLDSPPLILGSVRRLQWDDTHRPPQSLKRGQGIEVHGFLFQRHRENYFHSPFPSHLQFSLYTEAGD